MNRKRYIGGIPGDADEMGLAQLLGVYGDIDTIKIVRDKQTGKTRAMLSWKWLLRKGRQQSWLH